MENSAQNKSGLKTEQLPQKPQVLIAGCASSLGSYLSETLLGLGCRVYGVDNYISGEQNNLTQCLKNPDFVFIQKDLNNFKDDFPDSFDYVFHLAGVEEHLGKKDVSLEALLVNAVGTVHLLDLAKKDSAKFLLVSTINLEGPVSKTSLNANFGKNPDENRTYTHHEAKRYAEALVTQYFKKFHLNSRIVRVADIYGPRGDLSSETDLYKIFKQAVSGQDISLKGDGQEVVAPLFVTDCVWGIIKAMFGDKTEGMIYELVGREKITLLSFAEEVRNQLKNKTEIINLPKETETQSLFLAGGLKSENNRLGWMPKTTLEEGIKTTLIFYFGQQGTTVAVLPCKPSVARAPTQREKKVFFKRKKWAVLVLLTILILFFSPALYAGFVLLSVKSAYFESKKTKTEDLVVLERNVFKIKNNLKDLKSCLSFYFPAFWLTGKLQTYHNTQKVLDLGMTFLSGAGHGLKGVMFLTEATKNILSSDVQGGVGLQIGLSRKEFVAADDELMYVQSQFSTVDLNRIAFFKTDSGSVQKFIDEYKKYRISLSRLRDLTLVMPNMVGVDSKKTYLILFANNMELRPSGGFLGSYGLISFEKGKMIDLKIDDIYNADGQLTGHVDPPEPIRKYLAQPHWYLRDSNWSADFSEAAEKAEWFLQKEINKKVDGVILVDLNVARALLKVFGGVNLPDYQETITSQNLFIKANSYSQTDFFPGSTQKKDFLSSLAVRLLDKMISQWHEHAAETVFEINNLLDSKHLLFYFHDEATQNLFSRFNWAGRIAGDICQGSINCLGDYTMIVDANLGVNKANYFVNKTVKQKTEIESDLSIKGEITLEYTNSSREENKTEGTYRNYVRLYLPLDTKLTSLLIDGVQLVREEIKGENKKTKNQQNSLIDQVEEMGKGTYGFYFEVPPGHKKTITANYLLPFMLNTNEEAVYKMVYQKQSGSQKDDYNLEIVYPSTVRIKETTTGVRVESGRASFSKKQDGDEIMGVKFVKTP